MQLSILQQLFFPENKNFKFIENFQLVKVIMANWNQQLCIKPKELVFSLLFHKTLFLEKKCIINTLLWKF